MKKLITIVLSAMLLVGCSSTKELQIDNEQKYNLVNNIESLEIDSNWNIPVEGKISGIFCGFIDNHSFELLGEDGNYYAVSTLKLTNEDFSELESEKTNITIEYIIEDEGSQLTLLKIIEKQISEEDGEDILVVNFDAWLYQGYDDARAALLEVIAIKLNEAAQGDENIVKRTFNLFNRVDKVRALGLTIEGIALAHGIPTGGIVSRGLNAIKDVFNNGINEGNYKESIDSGKEIAKIGLIREKG